MLDRLNARNIETLRAVARVIIPPGGSLPPGADETDVAGRLAAEIATWPPRVRRQVKAMLTAVDALPLTTYRARFLALDEQARARFLEEQYHARSARRRLLASFLKQLCFSAYLADPGVEAAIGYTYTCLRPIDGARPTGQAHH